MLLDSPYSIRATLKLSGFEPWGAGINLGSHYVHHQMVVLEGLLFSTLALGVWGAAGFYTVPHVI